MHPGMLRPDGNWSLDMHEIIDDIFIRATEFMPDSNLHMTTIMFVSRRTSIFGAQWAGPRIGVSGAAQCGSQADVLTPSELQRRRTI